MRNARHVSKALDYPSNVFVLSIVDENVEFGRRPQNVLVKRLIPPCMGEDELAKRSKTPIPLKHDVLVFSEFADHYGVRGNETISSDTREKVTDPDTFDIRLCAFLNALLRDTIVRDMAKDAEAWIIRIEEELVKSDASAL